MLNNQLVLPGINLPVHRPISNPVFTYGIEVEMVEFYNNRPIDACWTSRIENEVTGDRYQAFLYGKRTRNDKREIVDQYLKAEVRDPEKTVLDLDSDGNPPDGWIFGHIDPDLHDSKADAVSQAKEILKEYDLTDWNVVWDESLTDAYLDGIEVISPIFKEGEENSIRQICDLFADRATTNWSCGLHVHVGIEGVKLTLSQLKWLVTKWIRIERSLIGLKEWKDENNLDVNLPLSEETDLQKVHAAKNEPELILAANYLGRDMMLNLWSLNKYGTIEFRGFNGTMDPDRIELLVQFCLNFMREVIS